ncbi:MAG TPA: hypothetical protein PK390_03170 [Fervidobacterium nodosum]|nr:hypothetical protein [Fervidobacterium nodosum]
MEIKEIVFWSIFLTMAILLFTGQLVLNVQENVKPSTISEKIEYLPDITKKNEKAVLVYENIGFSEKLSELSKKGITYGFGEYSGPSFNEDALKDSAIQIAYQEIIKKLDERKEKIKQSIKMEDKTKEEELLKIVDDIFSRLYQFIPEDNSLAIVYRIWKEDKKEVLSYYILAIFDTEYAFSLINSIFQDEISKFEEYGIKFEKLWSLMYEESKEK